MVAAMPKQDASELDEPQVVAPLLVVANEQSPTLRQPGQGALDDPPMSRITLLASLAFLLLANAPDVSDITSLSHDFPARFVVIAFVQTQVLKRFVVGRLWTLDHDRLERGSQESIVVAHV